RTGAQASPAHAPARRAPPRASVGKLSLVRQAVILLLADPSLADHLTAPYPFAQLDKPGIDLLAMLVDTIHAHPGIHTAALLEHFHDRPEYATLQKLATTPLIDNLDLGHEFQGALTQMQRQIGEQRIADLLAQQSAGGLGDTEKTELRELLKAKATR
ncbi:MAG TPA: DNA primase, partial [Oleiagrimonas sp.]|nr:DNA primase [Oleiagrimonas sp.]